MDAQPTPAEKFITWQERFHAGLATIYFPEMVYCLLPEAHPRIVATILSCMTAPDSPIWRPDHETGLHDLVADMLSAARLPRPTPETYNAIIQSTIHAFIALDATFQQLHHLFLVYDQQPAYGFMCDVLADQTLFVETRAQAHTFIHQAIQRRIMAIREDVKNAHRAEDEVRTDESAIHEIWEVLPALHRDIHEATKLLESVTNAQNHLAPSLDHNLVLDLRMQLNRAASALTEACKPSPVRDLFVGERIPQDIHEYTRETLALANYAPMLCGVYRNRFLTEVTRTLMRPVLKIAAEDVLANITHPVTPRPTRESVLQDITGPYGVLMSEIKLAATIAQKQAIWDTQQLDNAQWLAQFYSAWEVLEEFLPGISAHITSNTP